MSETATRTDRCLKCGKEGIPDTELIVVNNARLGWFGVCEDCTRADGLDHALGYRLAELRAGTLFCWWRNLVRQSWMRRDEDF